MQGVVFAFVGFAAGIIGTSLSNGLLAVRQRLDPKFESQNKPPNILLNAGTWAAHMGVSSNIRYQMLNGLDMVRIAIPVEVCNLIRNGPAACLVAESPGCMGIWNHANHLFLHVERSSIPLVDMHG